jgi:hypothetical protein
MQLQILRHLMTISLFLATQGTLWMPNAGNGAPGAIPVPHLLVIPKVLVDLLCTQGPAIMLHDVLLTVDDLPSGRARFSWKPAPSPLMTRTLTAVWEIIWIFHWGHAP